MLTIPAVLTLIAMGAAADSGPALTIYNQDFAVVRETVHLSLQAGMNRTTFADATVHLEPDSVILRDPSGKQKLRIIEQSFRNDPISTGLLLSLYEGKEIDFLVQRGDVQEIVRGKIIRSGYVPHYSAMDRYGQQYQARQMATANGERGQPVIEVDGKIRFEMPGEPLFPALPDDTILKPTLNWQIETDAAGEVDAELAYITGGMSWEANYNLVAPEKGDTLDLIGWVTVDNQCGKTFPDARLKLVAGDVNKIQRTGIRRANVDYYALAFTGGEDEVQEKSFDEYHLYTLPRPSTLRDRETKQIEFIRAAGVRTSRFYVYDGSKVDQTDWWNNDYRQQPQYGTECNPKVWAMLAVENTEANKLGMPLPAGRLRFYRQDTDGRLEFTGENQIDHTPRDETLRVYTGNAFDLVGERKQIDYRVDMNNHKIDESFEIKLRNRKKEPVEIRAVEHLYRWSNWEITAKSRDFTKIDARTIEFRVTVEPDKEETLTYTAHYEW